MQGLHVMDVCLRQCLCVRMRRGSVHDLAIVQSQELHHCFVTRPETRIVVCVSVDVGVCVCVNVLFHHHRSSQSGPDHASIPLAPMFQQSCI